MPQHVQTGTPAGGDLTGTYPSPTLANTPNVQAIVAAASSSSTATNVIPLIIALG